MKMTTFSAAKFEITNFDIQLIPKVYISGEEMRILHAKKLAHLHVNEKKNEIIFDATAVVSWSFYLI